MIALSATIIYLFLVEVFKFHPREKSCHVSSVIEPICVMILKIWMLFVTVKQARSNQPTQLHHYAALPHLAKLSEFNVTHTNLCCKFQVQGYFTQKFSTFDIIFKIVTQISCPFESCNSRVAVPIYWLTLYYVFLNRLNPHLYNFLTKKGDKWLSARCL